MRHLNRKKRIVSWIIIVISLPLAISFAATGGGVFGYLFAALLAIGIDMLTDVQIIKV